MLVIDLENAFVLPGSVHEIKMANATIPACKKVIEASRGQGIPAIYIKRIYRDDGSDVEITRWERWLQGNRPMKMGSKGISSGEYIEDIKPRPGDYLIIKKRWSAFFRTELDLLLHRLGVDTVAIIGTTTPNCIRTTAYDANSLDFEVIIIEDCTSSNTKEIQEANIIDMKNMGAIIMSSEEFVQSLPHVPRKGLVEKIRKAIQEERINPQIIEELDEGGVGYRDRW